jgi:tetratricopeptide (TPR) repeat protein
MYMAIAFVAATPVLKYFGLYTAIFTLYYCRMWSNNEALWRNSYAASDALRPALELSRLVDPQEARRILASRTTQGANNPNYHTELGRLAMQDRNAAEALRHFGKALALDPDRASHYYNRGAALFALGQREAALEDFQRTLKIDPTHRLAQQAIQQAK